MSKAAETRLTILRKAFEMVYRNGYQATSVDEIIATTQVTKGAFYYHFKSKDEMGLAMIKEVMSPGMSRTMVRPLLDSRDPVKEIYTMMQNVLLQDQFLEAKYGCPAINLIEEMAPLNKAFQKSLEELTTAWREAIQKSVVNGQKAGEIGAHADPGQVACFVLAGYGGIRNLGKIYGKACYETYLKELKAYLNKLK